MLRSQLIAFFLLLSQQAFSDNQAITLITDELNKYTGTAFQLMTRKGQLTVTNAHICKDQRRMFIRLTEPERYHLVLVKRVYPEHDLCVLTSTEQYPPLKMAKSYNSGDLVKVEGFPLGYHSITYGPIGEYFLSPLEHGYLLEYFGTVKPGNSGSPVIDYNGDVVGVVAVTGRRNGHIIGGFVPLEYLKEFLNE